jgi:hypothetical protein
VFDDSDAQEVCFAATFSRLRQPLQVSEGRSLQSRAALQKHAINSGALLPLLLLLCCVRAAVQLALVNASVLYVNPSETDDCVVYTQKRNFAFRQVLLGSCFPVVCGTGCQPA